MKKFIITLITFIGIFCNTNAQIKTNFLTLGYSRSVVHSSNEDGYSFNNINEVWVSFYNFEWSIYWDSITYSQTKQNYNEKINDKSYIEHNTSYFQHGYMGSKLGFKATYFSVGIVLDYGAHCNYYYKRNTHLNYIHSHYSDWEWGSSYNDYSKFGIGLYTKIHYNWKIFEPFISAQISTNKNTFVSVGISFILIN